MAEAYEFGRPSTTAAALRHIARQAITKELPIMSLHFKRDTCIAAIPEGGRGGKYYSELWCDAFRELVDLQVRHTDLQVTKQEQQPNSFDAARYVLKIGRNYLGPSYRFHTFHEDSPVSMAPGVAEDLQAMAKLLGQPLFPRLGSVACRLRGYELAGEVSLQEATSPQRMGELTHNRPEIVSGEFLRTDVRLAHGTIAVHAMLERPVAARL